jgi:uncharacterized LabA/DUF88 family protein
LSTAGPKTCSGASASLFIDGANLNATAKTLGLDIDYKRLRAFYYTAIIRTMSYLSIRPLIDWLDYDGNTVVTKATKEFIDAAVAAR